MSTRTKALRPRFDGGAGGHHWGEVPPTEPYGPVALGNGTQLDLLIYILDTFVHVGVEGKGYHRFSGRYMTPLAVKSLLMLDTESDGANLADLINALLHYVDRPDQGHYLRGCCLELEATS